MDGINFFQYQFLKNKQVIIAVIKKGTYTFNTNQTV